MTLGLPMVTASPPRNSRTGFSRAIASAIACAETGAQPPGEVEEIGGAGVFHDLEHAVERLRQGREAEDRDGEPDDVAERDAGREGERAARAAAEHPRDDRRDAGSGRGRGDEQRGGEDDEAGEIHGRLRVVHQLKSGRTYSPRLKRRLSASLAG